MALLIDSSVLIELERRGKTLSALIPATSGQPIALAAITASELLVGVFRADSPARRLKRESVVESLLETIPVLPFDLAATRVHARLLVQLALAGQPIGAHDLMIAATALTHTCAVLTHNVRDFRRVPGLMVQQPAW